MCWKMTGGRRVTYSSDNVDDRDLILGMILVLGAGLLRHQGPQLVKVHCWHVVLVLAQVEVPHTELAGKTTDQYTTEQQL